MFGLNPWIIVGLFVSHIALAVGGFSFGRSHEAGEQAKIQNEQAREYSAEIIRQQGVVDAQAAQIETLRAAASKKDRIITKEVIRYEQVTAPAERCDLPAAWRVLHDAAATGEPPVADAPGVSDAGAGAVADSAALETVADNYADCRRYAEQLKGWQRYYREIRAQAQGGD